MSRTCSDTSPDKYLEVGETLITAAPFTYAIWGRTTNGDKEQETGIMTQAGTKNRWVIRLDTTSSDRVENFADQTSPDTTGDAEISTSPAVDVWAHYAMVEAASDDRRGYLNGGNKATNTTDVIPNSIDTTSIGQTDDGTPNNRRFDGDLGHAAIWNVALTDQEIETLAAGFSPRRIRPDNFVGYWPLNGQSPEYNVLGTGVNLTLFGGPLVAEEPPIPHFMVAPG